MNQRTKDEIGVQIVQIVGLVAGILVARRLAQPDVLQSLRLRSLLVIKRTAENQAELWNAIAARAATGYHKARL